MTATQRDEICRCIEGVRAEYEHYRALSELAAKRGDIDDAQRYLHMTNALRWAVRHVDRLEVMV